MLYKKGFGYGLILSLILLVLIFSFSACNKKKQPSKEVTNGLPVIIMPVEKGSIESITQYTGIVKPKKMVYVVSPISGRVSNAYFEVGDKVKKGETLFSIESKELAANIRLLEEQLKVAKANITLAEASVISAMGSGYEGQKMQLKSSLTSAEYNYTAAKKAFDAAVILYETKIIDSFKYYEIKNQFEQANNALKTTDNAYRLFIDRLSKEAINSSNQQLKQAQASYDSIKIQIENAKEQLKYTNIESPMDGIIVAKDIFESSLISNTMAPYIVADTDTVQVAIFVSEKIINKISKDNKLEVSIPAAGEGIFKGKVTSVSPVMDTKTLSYQILIDIPNKNDLIKPGMTAKVCISVDKREDIILVPLNSILSDDSVKYVFTVEGNKAVKRFVDTGISNTDSVEITKGLELGNFIVVKGQQFLKHNDAVNVSQEDSK